MLRCEAFTYRDRAGEEYHRSLDLEVGGPTPPDRGAAEGGRGSKSRDVRRVFHRGRRINTVTESSRSYASRPPDERLGPSET